MSFRYLMAGVKLNQTFFQTSYEYERSTNKITSWNTDSVVSGNRSTSASESRVTLATGATSYTTQWTAGTSYTTAWTGIRTTSDGYSWQTADTRTTSLGTYVYLTVWQTFGIYLLTRPDGQLSFVHSYYQTSAGTAKEAFRTTNFSRSTDNYSYWSTTVTFSRVTSFNVNKSRQTSSITYNNLSTSWNSSWSTSTVSGGERLTQQQTAHTTVGITEVQTGRISW